MQSHTQKCIYSAPLHSSLLNVGNPKYCQIFLHSSCNIVGAVTVRGNSSPLTFFGLTYFHNDNISSKSIQIALKTLEAKHGPIKFFTSNSGSQLRESALMDLDEKTGEYAFK